MCIIALLKVKFWSEISNFFLASQKSGKSSAKLCLKLNRFDKELLSNKIYTRGTLTALSNSPIANHLQHTNNLCLFFILLFVTVKVEIKKLVKFNNFQFIYTFVQSTPFEKASARVGSIEFFGRLKALAG